MLEPDPEFLGGNFYPTNYNCLGNFGYYDAETEKWNCPWDVNS
jgi:hypothetical protein